MVPRRALVATVTALAVAAGGAAQAAPAKAPVVKKNVVRAQAPHNCPFSHDAGLTPTAGV